MNKSMWIILILSILALSVSLFTLYRVMLLNKAGSQSDFFSFMKSTEPAQQQTAEKADETIFVPEYETVPVDTLWDHRAELSGKKIEITTSIDTDTMLLQPPKFTTPIELLKSQDPRTNANKDTWPRNNGVQTVVIQGSFNMGVALGTVGTQTLETFSIVVDRMLLKEDADRTLFHWVEAGALTPVIGAETFSGFNSGSHQDLDGRSVAYIGTYAPLDFSRVNGMLDRLVTVDLEHIGDSALLDKLSAGDHMVKVWGIFHIKQGLHGPLYFLEAGKIEILP